MKFLRNLLATIVGLIIFSIFSLFLFLAVVGNFSAEKEVTVESNSILKLNLNKPFAEFEIDDPLSDVPFFGAEDDVIGIIQLKQAIAEAKTDNNIEGIYLNASFVMAGYAKIEELRNALLDFKESGKFIIAYSDYYSEATYYIASVADKVFMNPIGDVEFNGLSANISFFKKTFEKLGIEPQIFRVGDFKSAVEPFTRENMSDPNRLQLTSLLKSLYSNIVNNIATSRNIDVVRLTNISDQMLVQNAEDARDMGLVDELLYLDEVYDILKEESGSSDLEFISYDDYKKTVSSYKRSDNEIAVIVAEGDIVRGGDDQRIIVGDKFAREIRKAREKDKVKAIVIRINSPGGDYLSSDVMWREIKLAAEVKPVIASMSDYAASGGYYMAMACDTIVAQPTTITGSIGIFGMIFNIEGFLGDKLGITHDVVTTGNYSDIMTMTRPLTAAEKSIIQKGTEEGYETFTTKASEGRNMNIEDLLKIASGRVWTGAQALDNGLVDVLGGFDDAVQLAAEKAGIQDDYKLKYYPKYLPLLQRLMDKPEEIKASYIKSELGEMYYYYEALEQLKQKTGIQARMPFDIHFE